MKKKIKGEKEKQRKRKNDRNKKEILRKRY